MTVLRAQLTGGFDFWNAKLKIIYAIPVTILVDFMIVKLI